MYFVINGFITTVCIVTLILFTEVFPKLVKLVIGAAVVYTSSYALAILVKKIGEWTSLYPAPADVFPNFYYILCGVTLIAIFMVAIMSRKGKK